MRECGTRRWLWAVVIWLVATVVGGGYASGQAEARRDQLWSFEGIAGQVVSVEVISTEFDPAVELLAPTGELVGFDDDGGSGLNAALVTVLPATGWYRVRATSIDQHARGSYDIAVRLMDVQPLTAQTTAIGVLGGRGLEAGGFWSVDGVAGQVFRVEASSDEFDTMVALLSPTGESLGSNDDGGNRGTDSRLVAVVPESGRQLIQVTSFGGEGSGEYSVNFGIVDTPPLLAQGVARGTEADQANFLSFEGVAGRFVRVQATSEDFGPVIEVVSPEGDSLGIDDGGGVVDAALVTVLPVTGQYTIRVAASFGGTARGLYEVAVQPMVVQALDVNTPGRATLMEGGSEAQVLWSFEGVPGQAVVVKASSEDFDTVAKLLVPTGEVLAVNDDGGIGTNSELTAVLPETGEYLVQVTSYDGGSGGYEVMLSTVDTPVLVPGVTSRGTLN